MSTPATTGERAPVVLIWRNHQGPDVYAAPGLLPQPVADAVLPALGFEPDPAEAGLFTLTDPEHDGQERARAAVRALRTMGHQVGTEPDFDVPGTTLRHRDEPDVVFGEHPYLGIVAAVSDGLPIDPAPFLTKAGWHHTRGLDIYLAPSVEREAGLDAIAAAGEQLHHGRYNVAVQRHLAADVHARRADTRERGRARVSSGAPAPTPTARSAAEAAAAPVSAERAGTRSR
ncbi:hypothetical protein [Streptomyces sp. TLI_171]|uniref:hypothetical protein n=1 Tax=Streptomyces sp. TLI_171 TaxID=1938859 RepID=UPI000C1A353B|nr:hypothetical protein [Streptomyces sp. TLI_171]RKE22015.1 hypothetical protein BX266_5425 [Streptomyces sp. TLI_171]